MRKQVLNGMRSFAEIDDKIKIHSRYWRHIRIIGVTYFGGSYSVGHWLKYSIAPLAFWAAIIAAVIVTR